jgi:hypothetical protein
MALFKVVLIYCDITVLFYAHVTVFCTVVVGYNLIKYVAMWSQKKRFAYRNAIVALTLGCMVLFLLLFINEQPLAWALFMLIAALSLVYTMPLFHKQGLRYFPVVKLFIVAISWVLLLLFYPVLTVYNDQASVSAVAVFEIPFFELRAAQLVIFVLALCIPFEIRDLKYDEITLRTLPQLVGIKTAKIIGLLLLLHIPLLEFLEENTSTFLGVEVLVIITITGMAIWFSDQFKTDYYASFFVEAIPVLWLFLLWFK